MILYHKLKQQKIIKFVIFLRTENQQDKRSLYWPQKKKEEKKTRRDYHLLENG